MKILFFKIIEVRKKSTNASFGYLCSGHLKLSILSLHGLPDLILLYCWTYSVVTEKLILQWTAQALDEYKKKTKTWLEIFYLKDIDITWRCTSP